MFVRYIVRLGKVVAFLVTPEPQFFTPDKQATAETAYVVAGERPFKEQVSGHRP